MLRKKCGALLLPIALLLVPARGSSAASSAPGYPPSIGGSTSYESIQNVTYTFDRDGNMRLVVAVHIANPTGCAVGNPCPEYDDSPEYVNAWVDWNGNKSFEANERVLDQAGTGYSNINYSGTMSFVTQVPVPRDAATRIYLRVNLGWSHDPNDPHEYKWTWGDVQDYLIDFGAWRADLQVGTILAHRIFGPIAISGWWTHVGVYAGDGQVIEAVAGGVVRSPITNWDYPRDIDVEALHVNGGYSLAGVMSFLEDQIGKPYHLTLFSKHADRDAEDWYCSELAWAAYRSEHIDIEDTPDSIVVTPTEISDDNDTERVSGHGRMADGTVLPQDSEDNSLTVEAHSPVDIEVIDPEGLLFNKATAPQSSEFTYAETDVDGDGDREDLVIVHHRKVGTYVVRVVPELGALPTDTYTLIISAYGVPATVADGVQVSDIPFEGYSVKSGEAWVVLPPSANHAPDADAGLDRTVAWIPGGTSVRLDASKSSDPDGDVLSYVWVGPFVESHGTVTGVSPTVTFSSPGVHVVNLGVDDGRGEWDMDSVTINVAATSGDTNGDGKVDCDDVAVVKRAFGTRRDQAGFDPRADVNNDGVVNIRDLAFVTQKLPLGTKCK